MGAGNAGVGVAPGREPPAAVLSEEIGPEPEPAPSRDFRITEAHGIGQGGLKEKARDNIAAIRTLKLVEAEGREATEPEKAQLARYSGWGALPNVFHPYPPREWEPAAREVREVLSDEEYESARASTPNAHFTSPVVIGAMWKALERFGLQPGAQILEPSMGVGHFFGLEPEGLLRGSQRTGVELDSVTARIARQLYPDAKVFAKGFEDTPLPDNFFDVVIGNIPFGNYPVYDPGYRNRALTRTIHDYFLAKSLDKVRAGGVVALITSRYTMDKQEATIRRYLAGRADLVGAIRLPNTAFKENAGTEVTTDIIFLQKRENGVSAQGEAWEELGLVETPDGAVHINEYFARHPEMMLGEMRLEGTMYKAREPTLAGVLSPERLAQAVQALPENVYRRRQEPRGRAPPAPEGAGDVSGVKEGAFAERSGVIVVRRAGIFEPVKLGYSVAARVRGMMGVRDAVRAVFQTQLEDAPEERIVEARRALNRIYDSFVARYGPVSSRENVKAFAGDPDQPLLLSLENYDARDEARHQDSRYSSGARWSATGRSSMSRRRRRRWPCPSMKPAEIRWPRMEQVTGRTATQLQRELGASSIAIPRAGYGKLPTVI